MMAPVLIWPPIHNIVVVTSPIGVQAPPALAAMMTIPAKNLRCSASLINFLSNETMTMEVVRLSKTEERKKVMMETIQRSLTVFLVVMRSVIMRKP